jgi:anti-sigma regulatory factor (Ser/Thr protein kinase)
MVVSESKRGFRARKHRMTAQLDRLKEARDFAAEAAEDFGLGKDGRYHVRLAMSEAVANAIQHGSSSNADEIVLAAFEEAGALVFEVADRGRFVPRVRPRGELPERGRGLEFMRRLMDEVDIRPGDAGTVLRFAIRA